MNAGSRIGPPSPSSWFPGIDQKSVSKLYIRIIICSVQTFRLVYVGSLGMASFVQEGVHWCVKFLAFLGSWKEVEGRRSNLKPIQWVGSRLTGLFPLSFPHVIPQGFPSPKNNVLWTSVGCSRRGEPETLSSATGKFSMDPTQYVEQSMLSWEAKS